MRRGTRAPCSILFAFLLAACNTVAMPRVPQVEQATQAVEGGRDRYRAHQACTKAATTIDQLVDCMREAGWNFVARGPFYPESGCWQARDRSELDRLTDICFVRAGSAQDTPASKEP
jgi:hypothetical protein